MAVVQIPNLPLAVGLDGNELLEIVQAGTSKKTYAQQLLNLGVPVNTSTFIQSVAQLRAMPVMDNTPVYVEGYYNTYDQGGGYFFGASGALPGTYVDNGGTIIVPTGGDGSSAWIRQREPAIDVRQFGAKGDNSTDDTTAINNALAYAKLNQKKVFVPAGRYIVSQIIVPDDIEFYGVAIGNYGNSPVKDTSVIVQKQGVNKDALVFTTFIEGAYYRIGPTYIHDLTIKKDNGTTDTIGNGINFADASGNYAMVNGDFIIERVQVRGFPENGIYAKLGGTPCYFRTVDTLFNKGYGIRWDGEVNSQCIVFEDCAGDGNAGGSAIKIAAQSSNATFFIYGTYAEYRNDNPYTSPTGAQPHAIEIGDFLGSNGTVYISGVEAHSVVSSGPPLFNDLIDSAIYVNISSSAYLPYISWKGVGVLYTVGMPGNAYVLRDDNAGVTADYTCKDGYYANNKISGTNSTIGGAGGGMGFGTGNPSALVHINQPVLSSSATYTNLKNTKSHTAGYWNTCYLTGSTNPDFYTYSDGSVTEIGATTNKTLNFYSNNLLIFKANSGSGVAPGSDGSYNLGNGSLRWDTVYAVTGTINTSDEREKTNISSLSESEKAVAAKLKTLVRSFKFKNAIDKKGNDARIHFGVIAQDVMEAFKSEGLDPFKYGMICYDKWESLPERKDEDGNIKENEVSAGDRYGVRYEELFAFIISAL